MEYVQLRAYDNYIEAHLRLQQLEAEGIRAVLKDEYTVTIDPMLSNAVGGIKLMVPDVQWQRANTVIESLEKKYRGTLTCPQCGSHSIQKVANPHKPLNWFTALTSWLLGSYAIAVKDHYRCFECGYATDQLPEQEAGE